MFKVFSSVAKAASRNGLVNVSSLRCRSTEAAASVTSSGLKMREKFERDGFVTGYQVNWGIKSYCIFGCSVHVRIFWSLYFN